MSWEHIPSSPIDREEVLEMLRGQGADDVDWHSGRVWSLVYHASDEHKKFLADAHATFASGNLLNPMAFKSLKQMEAEVVRMTANMLNAPEDAVGTMSSGGTESILLAVKAARDRARRKRWWVRKPEMVVPETIHVAFDKAAHYFGLDIKRVPLDEDYRVDVDALKRAVGRNTVFIAASAPQYAHGMVDPIAEIGEFAQSRNIPFHVDACFGGFILPWLEELGHDVPVFDFRVPGVTSMSADIHKYGYAAKGASIVVYRSMDYLKHQFYVSTDSPVGIYASPTLLGTRPGGPIAAAWATLLAMGREGYLDLARRTMEAKAQLLSGLREIDGLEILGSEHATIVTWRASDPEVSTYAIADQLTERGWGVDRQQMPASIHCTVTANHLDAVEPYLKDVAESLDAVRANPDLAREGEAAMYGMMAKVPIRGAVKLGVMKVMEAMYSPGGEPPDLGNLEGDGGLLSAFGDLGPRAMEVLEKVDDIRGRIRAAFNGE
jgi:glutamate/tyrosine decarboxylase-like PLP-dependent enzyme